MHRREVVAEVRAARGNGLTVAQLERKLAGSWGPGRSRDLLVELLDQAEERGEVVRTKGRIVATEYTDLYAGPIRMTSRGFGIVRQGGRDLPDIVIPPEGLGSALDGDEVLVHLGARRKRGRLVPEKHGEVVRVLRRRRPTLVGRYVADPEQPWVDPFARRVNMKVLLDEVPVPTPRPGEFVEVALDGVPGAGPVGGTLVRRLGLAGESGVDEEVVLAELAVPVEFAPAARAEADALADDLRPTDLAGRVDRRGQPAVTIDGETARDFDDAVVAMGSPGGAIEVFVHIADVSHYVAPGSALDGAARERGTSVYLPGRCVPMLPEKLSNNLCSLIPEKDRLAFSVRFAVTPDGAVEGYRAERAVFRSRRRCTYTEVFDWLEHGAWPEAVTPEVRHSLELLDEAARRLGRRRVARGSIDFDLPEPEILLDPEGFMLGVQAAPRNRAHRLIEELMVAANECVARMLTWGRQPGLFRIHERPSAGKLAELQAVLSEFDVALKGNLEDLPPRELQRVLSEIVGRPEEKFLQTLVLRSLARAAYHPECRGHYALATSFYLHFTSPIRRYPDLVVHRYLGELLAGHVLQGTERAFAEADLEDLAQSCSFTERRADEAEREVVKWKQVEYMRARIGEEFSGRVTGVVAFGMFVQLDEVFVEGLVHVADLRDDFYRYDETGHRLVGQQRGRVLRLGDAVRVRVKGIDEEFMEVKLEPILPPIPVERRERGRRLEPAEDGKPARKAGRPPRRPTPRTIRRGKSRGPRR
ncbi:MAG TPA: ribonuclease R [Thermoanaerobaculaceae bacterium]|nr:ribonuclease R [Thermoanaerobaculaceae bacterium]